jgi:hypothetical protein
VRLDLNQICLFLDGHEVEGQRDQGRGTNEHKKSHFDPPAAAPCRRLDGHRNGFSDAFVISVQASNMV